MKTLTVSGSLVVVAALGLALPACGGDKGPKKEAKADAKAQGNEDGKDDAKKEADAPADAPSHKDAMLASLAAYNAGEFDKALEVFADDFEWHYAGRAEPIKGKEGAKKAWTEWRTSFPDAKLTAKQIVVAGDTLAAHMVFTGTHKGDFRGTAPTDKPIGGELLIVSTSKDGKATKWMEYVNFLTVQGQIGNMPEGMPVTPVPEAPSGEPTIVEGEANDANVALVKSWYDGFANPPEDFGAFVDEHLTEDSIHYNTASGEKKEGSQVAKDEIPQMFKAFENVKIEDLSMVSAGDYVLAQGSWSGKHVGDMGPLKASNKEFKVEFGELLRIKDGKIAESWGFENSMQFLTQIGAIPEPAPAGEGEGEGEKVAAAE